MNGLLVATQYWVTNHSTTATVTVTTDTTSAIAKKVIFHDGNNGLNEDVSFNYTPDTGTLTVKKMDVLDISCNDISANDISCNDISGQNAYFFVDISCNGNLNVGGTSTFNDISANDISCVDISAVNFFSVGSSFFGYIHATDHSTFHDISANDISANDISGQNAYFTGDISCNGQFFIGGLNIADPGTPTQKYLRDDGHWHVGPGTTTTYSSFVGASVLGLVPGSSGSAGQYLRGDGNWTTPPTPYTYYTTPTGNTNSSESIDLWSGMNLVLNLENININVTLNLPAVEANGGIIKIYSIGETSSKYTLIQYGSQSGTEISTVNMHETICISTSSYGWKCRYFDGFFISLPQ
jgi:hypothetical protein